MLEGKYELTEEDIAEGVPNNMSQCILAKMLNRTICGDSKQNHSEVAKTSTCVFVNDKVHHLSNSPQIIKMIIKFDKGKTIHPTSIVIEKGFIHTEDENKYFHQLLKKHDEYMEQEKGN